MAARPIGFLVVAAAVLITSTACMSSPPPATAPTTPVPLSDQDSTAFAQHGFGPDALAKLPEIAGGICTRLRLGEQVDTIVKLPGDTLMEKWTDDQKVEVVRFAVAKGCTDYQYRVDTYDRSGQKPG